MVSIESTRFQNKIELSELLESITILVKKGVKESTAKIKGKYITIKLDVFVLMANIAFVQQLTHLPIVSQKVTYCL